MSSALFLAFPIPKMLLWTVTLFFLILSFTHFFRDGAFWKGKVGIEKQRRSLRGVTLALREIEEILMAGLVPTSRQWSSLRDLPDPWGTLTSESVEGLRTCGGSLLPTLKRLRQLAEDQDQSLGVAQAKSSQAFAQALACTALVPILGAALYPLLPAVHENSRSWLIGNAFAILLAGVGALWLMHMTEIARWGGIREHRRPWVLGSLCAGERFLALVRSGTPPDLAWAKTCDLLSHEVSELAMAWGHSIWEESRTSIFTRPLRPAEHSMVSTGAAIRKSVQVSLMEGRPCLDRVETALFALRSELKTHIERELTLLATRALKPLFVCVAPGLMGLLFYGLWLVFTETTGGGLLE